MKAKKRKAAARAKHAKGKVGRPVKAAKAVKSVKSKTNGAIQAKPTGPQPAPKSGPNMTIRMRSQEHIEQVRKAAEKSTLSMNTWIVEVLERAAASQ